MFSPPLTFYGATAIYLSSHFLIHILSTNFCVPYLHSEWLCWSFLLFAAKLVRPSKNEDQNTTTQSDKLALAIAAVCAFRTVGGVDWALVCPCVLLVRSPTNPLLPIATTHAIGAIHRTPGCQYKPSTRVSRKGSACRDSLPPWVLRFETRSGFGSNPCATVCGLASTDTIFSMAGLRRTYFRLCPDGRLHVDLRTKRRTVVGTGSGSDTSTLSCDIMAGLSCLDHDAVDCPQDLFANKVF